MKKIFDGELILCSFKKGNKIFINRKITKMVNIIITI